MRHTININNIYIFNNQKKSLIKIKTYFIDFIGKNLTINPTFKLTFNSFLFMF